MGRQNDGIMMLLDAVYFNNKKVGLITEDGIDWGGNEAEFINVYAAQFRKAPVKKIKTKDATNLITFNMFELVPQNCADLLGGNVSGEKWDAPSESVSLEGPLSIKCGTGQTISIKNVSLDGSVRGGLGGEKKLGIECSMEMLTPADGGSPFSLGVTKPSIKITGDTLSFEKGGGSKTAILEASGPFKVGTVPEGFSVEVERSGLVTVTAVTNEGGQRTGKIEFSLVDGSQKCSLNLTQKAGNA